MLSALRVDYACVYGISSGVSSVEDGVQLSLLDHGLTIHVFNGKKGKVFWFVIIDRPRYGTQDARKICDSLKSKKLDSSVTFGDFWDNCDVFTMTPLEEGCFKTWHQGRLVCMGDAVRKVSVPISSSLRFRTDQ